MHWIDPEYLPETAGVVDCFLLNSDGEADGLVLQDGTEVHFPPHMGRDVLAAVAPGSTVRVRGVRPRHVAMVAAVSIKSQDGTRLVDAGPPDDDADRKAARQLGQATRTDMEVRGVVRQLLHGPKGEIRGVLLQDGRAGRFPPHAAQHIVAMMAPNAPVLLRGAGLVTPHGTVIAVQAFGTSADDIQPVEAKKPKKDHKDHKPHKDHKSPKGHKALGADRHEGNSGSVAPL